MNKTAVKRLRERNHNFQQFDQISAPSLPEATALQTQDSLELTSSSLTFFFFLFSLRNVAATPQQPSLMLTM